MLPGRPSQTMLRTAALRAAHQLLDKPLILHDPIAVGLVPESSERAVLATLDEHRNQVALRLFFALRSRFAEDRLAEAAARGVRQYVIVGAGLDTFPWRQPDYARNMKIFAVDHVSTLASTQVIFRDRGLPKPANLTFVSADLEERRIGKSLSEFGFDPDVPSLCSVLGVTQYLSARCRRLAAICLVTEGGQRDRLLLCTDGGRLAGDDVQIAVDAGRRNAAIGEPWKTRLRPRELVERLTQLGFSDVFHLTPELAHRRYFSGRGDGSHALGVEQIICAIV